MAQLVSSVILQQEGHGFETVGVFLCEFGTHAHCSVGFLWLIW